MDDRVKVTISEGVADVWIGSPNQREAVRANIEKRAPRFADV
jgi:hypothetical protein